jgi:Tripartite tricarboxylate transporter family receptor
MKFPRPQFLHLAAGAAALPGMSRLAGAQTFPARPVRLLVGYPPGGASDIIARLMGQWLSERLGRSFIIENRPGAASNIAAEAVVRAPPDGHTLLMVGTPNVVSAALYDKLNYNFIRDIAPVAGIILTPNLDFGQFSLLGNGALQVFLMPAGIFARSRARPGPTKNSVYPYILGHFAHPPLRKLAKVKLM